MIWPEFPVPLVSSSPQVSSSNVVLTGAELSDASNIVHEMARLLYTD